MSRALEAAAPFVLLLLPGTLPLLFFIHHRLICASPPATAAHTPCLCVCLLGPLSALSATFGIVALDRTNPQTFLVAQNVVNCLAELGYRTAIVYLIAPSSALVGCSHVSLSSKGLRRHNVFLSCIIFIAFILSILHLSLSAIPRSVPSAFCLAAALFPIPLLVHLALSAPSQRVRRIWFFAVVLQLVSGFTAILRIPSGPGYVLACAVCTMLWGSGILVLFYALVAPPISPPVTAPRPHGRPKFALLAPAATHARVHYHTRSLSPSAGVLASEDFTALRDPFASPPPVSPISAISPVFPRLLRPSTPTAMRKEVSEDGPCLKDEVLLNQAVLHSLTRDACAECPTPEAVRDVQGVRVDPEDVELQAIKLLHTIPAWWNDA